MEAKEKQPNLERGPVVVTFHYDDPKPCRECGGRGCVVLLVSRQKCSACGGSGQIWREPRREAAPVQLGYYRRKEDFDEQGRVISIMTWFEPVCNEDGSKIAAAEDDGHEKTQNTQKG